MSMRTPKIMIVRHAEKPAEQGLPHGINLVGQTDPESLIPLGWQRAGALAGFFVPSSGAYSNPRIARPQFLFASGVGKHSHSLRPQETITPSSQKLGITIDTTYLKGQEAALAAAVVGYAGVVLIAWEHQDIPTIANAIVGNNTMVPQHWPGDRFDLVWVFDFDAAKGDYVFSQVPQLLLAGDRAAPIV